MGQYVKLSVICSTLLRIIMKIWTYSGLCILLCIFLYYAYGGIVAFLLLLVAIFGLLYHAEDYLLYNPEMPSHSRVFVPKPSMVHLPFENVWVKTFDGVLLHMYFIYQPVERKRHCPTILFFHGNAGNMGHRLQNCVELYHNLHCNILLVEYRGYGLSEGSPSEEGLYTDSRAGLDYLYSRNDINHSEIIIFGRSLGGAVAIDLASRVEFYDKIWCVVVENTFTSIPDMARVFFKWRILRYIPLLCYKNKYLSSYKITFLRAPTLFISGLADNLVPPRMMSELYSRCGSTSKRLLEVPRGTHNETWTQREYYHSVAVFLQNCRVQAAAAVSSTNEQQTIRVESSSGSDNKEYCVQIHEGNTRWSGVQAV